MYWGVSNPPPHLLVELCRRDVTEPTLGKRKPLFCTSKIYKVCLSTKQINPQSNPQQQNKIKEEIIEVNKLKDIASFFNVSIDYLLGYDMADNSCKEFLKKLKKHQKRRLGLKYQVAIPSMLWMQM